MLLYLVAAAGSSSQPLASFFVEQLKLQEIEIFR
jgi:hypothetical protein